MSGSEAVALGVPVHRGRDFVAETLNSIRDQTHRDLRVVISIDGPDPESEEACHPFLDDPRFRMVVQPENLGWAQNISWLMDQVETPYWCYQQQDDLLDQATSRPSWSMLGRRPRPRSSTATSRPSATGRRRSPSPHSPARPSFAS